MATIDQVKQEALRHVQHHYHLDPSVRYQSLIADLPLEALERSAYTRKFYIQIEGIAALVYYTEPDHYVIDEDVQGYQRLTFGHI